MTTAMFLKAIIFLSMLFSVTLATAVTPNYALPPPQPVQEARPSTPVVNPTIISQPKSYPDKNEIARVIAKWMGTIQYCFETELKDKPKIHGKIVVLATIGIEGLVTKSDIQETTMNDLPTEKCIVYVFSRMKFPKPTEGIVEISYPLVFGLVPGLK